MLEATGPLLSGLAAITLTLGLVVVFVATMSPSFVVVVVGNILIMLNLVFITLSGIGATVGVLHSVLVLVMCRLEAMERRIGVKRIWDKCDHGTEEELISYD